MKDVDVRRGHWVKPRVSLSPDSNCERLLQGECPRSGSRWRSKPGHSEVGGRLRVADQGGGPVLEGRGDCRDAAGQAGGQDEAGRSNARSTRSITRLARLPQ